MAEEVKVEECLVASETIVGPGLPTDWNSLTHLPTHRVRLVQAVHNVIEEQGTWIVEEGGEEPLNAMK